MTRVRLGSCRADAMYLEYVGLPMLRSVVGQGGPPHALLEALAADTLSELGPEGDEPEDEAAPARRRRPGRRAAVPDEGGDATVRRVLHRFASRLGGVPAVAWPNISAAASGSPGEVRAILLRLLSWRQGLEWQRARLLALFHSRGWHALRKHATFSEWHHHRLGLSPVEAMGLLRLSRVARELPAIDAEWRAGRIGARTARLIGTIARPENAGRWAKHARRATPKRLELDVADQLAMRAAMDRTAWLSVSDGAPRPEVPMSALRIAWDRLWEKIRQGGGGFQLHPSGSACAASLVDGPLMSTRRATIAFDAPVPTAGLIREAIRQMARATGFALDEGGCLRAMLERFASTHVTEGLRDRTLRAKVLRRDGWECAMPHCRSRGHLDAHHVVFKSRGGSDEHSNMLTLCRGCHRLLHDERIRAIGLAPDGLLFRIGRDGPDAEWHRDGIQIDDTELADAWRIRRKARWSADGTHALAS